MVYLFVLEGKGKKWFPVCCGHIDAFPHGGAAFQRPKKRLNIFFRLDHINNIKEHDHIAKEDKSSFEAVVPSKPRESLVVGKEIGKQDEKRIDGHGNVRVRSFDSERLGCYFV